MISCCDEYDNRYDSCRNSKLGYDNRYSGCSSSKTMPLSYEDGKKDLRGQSIITFNIDKDGGKIERRY